MKAYRLNLKDKKVLSKNRCCPPHCLFHKLPFTEKVTDEPCHIHYRRWRMAHHIFFCRYLKCPHYEFMMQENQRIKNQKK